MFDLEFFKMQKHIITLAERNINYVNSHQSAMMTRDKYGEDKMIPMALSRYVLTQVIPAFNINTRVTSETIASYLRRLDQEHRNNRERIDTVLRRQ